MVRIWRWIGVGLLLFLLVGCSSSNRQSAPVLTTILPWYCVATTIAGPELEVQNLLPPNVGPHDYQLTPSDMRRIRESKLILLNGLGLDDWLLRAITASQTSKVLKVAESLKYDLIRSVESEGHSHDHSHHGHDHGEWNPHLWLDPTALIPVAELLAQRFGDLLPEHRSLFQQRARDLISKLEALDAEISEGLKPVENRAFVTYHDAFPYFARRYQLEIAGVIEEVPDLSPSAKYMSDLYETIKLKRVSVVFTEPQFPGRFAQRMVEDLGLTLSELDTLETGELHPEAYFLGMRKNLGNLQQHLK